MTYSQNRGTVFTFRNSFAIGTQKPAANVYTVWADLIADIAGIDGHKTIVFDFTDGFADVTIPAETYDLLDITLSGGPSGSSLTEGFPLDPDPSPGGNTSGKTLVELADGVIFSLMA